ncbi:MAG TPA: hypothetical protein VF808_14785, partial [Ktedonobacterales bacterium]
MGSRAPNANNLARVGVSLHFNQHQVAGNQDNCWHEVEQPQREVDYGVNLTAGKRGAGGERVP